MFNLNSIKTSIRKIISNCENSFTCNILNEIDNFIITIEINITDINYLTINDNDYVTNKINIVNNNCKYINDYMDSITDSKIYEQVLHLVDDMNKEVQQEINKIIAYKVIESHQ